MKPTSIIFLILSIILIAAGSVTCITAQKMAEANGIELFDRATDDEDNGVEINEFKSVNKIALYLKNVNVTIVGNAESSYVKLVNFSKNTYEYVVSNKNMTIEDSVSVMSLFKITSDGFNFDGLRHFLYYDQYKDKQKSIEIGISKEDEIKQFDIEVENGNVSVTRVINQADYNIVIGEGTLDLSIPRSVSTVNIKIGKGDATFTANNTYTGNIGVEIADGDFIASVKDNSTRTYSLNTAAGEINLFGESKGETLELEPLTPQYTYTVNVKKGNITLAYPPAGEDETGGGK